jgi:hypothetical protein
MVYADDVNIMNERVHNIEKNTEAFVVGIKENFLELKADKNNYILMSLYQNAGRSQHVNIMIAPLKCSTVLISGNIIISISILEEIEKRWIQGIC